MRKLAILFLAVLILSPMLAMAEEPSLLGMAGAAASNPAVTQREVASVAAGNPTGTTGTTTTATTSTVVATAGTGGR